MFVKGDGVWTKSHGYHSLAIFFLSIDATLIDVQQLFPDWTIWSWPVTPPFEFIHFASQNHIESHVF